MLVAAACQMNGLGSLVERPDQAMTLDSPLTLVSSATDTEA